MAFVVICKYRKILDIQAVFIIFLYMFCALMLLGFTIYDILTVDQADPKFIRVPGKVAEFVIAGVFYYFLFELHLVKLKLESSSLEQFLSKLKRARILLWSMLTVILLTFSLDALIDELYQVQAEAPDGTLNTSFIIDQTGFIFTVIIDSTMVYLLWAYFIYFFKKKKNFLSKQGGQFTFNEKVFILLTAGILVFNSLNIFAYNVASIVSIFITGSH